MIVQKYQYHKISRCTVDGKRHYLTPDNQKVASVTTILDKTKPAEARAALNRWKSRMGHKQAAQMTIEAANRGTRMHSFIENYIRNGSLGDPGTNPYSIQSFNMAQRVLENGLKDVDEFYGSEINLYYPQLYAGTTDTVGLYKGNLAIIDFKQTNKPKKEEWITDYKLQLSAYAEAHDILYGTKITKGIIMMCSQNLEYQQWIVENDLQKYKDLWWDRVEEFYQLT